MTLLRLYIRTCIYNIGSSSPHTTQDLAHTPSELNPNKQFLELTLGSLNENNGKVYVTSNYSSQSHLYLPADLTVNDKLESSSVYSFATYTD